MEIVKQLNCLLYEIDCAVDLQTEKSTEDWLRYVHICIAEIVNTAAVDAKDERTTASPAPCKWAWDDVHDKWETACGQDCQFTDSSPVDNGFMYCCFCGGTLTKVYSATPVEPRPCDKP